MRAKLIFLVVLAGVVSLWYTLSISTKLPVFSYSKEEAPRMLFVGDVMLGRAVEDILLSASSASFFDQVASLHSAHANTIINFEASMRKDHVRTPDMTFALAVHKDVVPLLSRIGVTHASLANNHTSDFGREGLEYTRTTLQASEIQTFGSPYATSGPMVSTLTLGDTKVALFGISAAGVPFERDHVAAIMATYASSTDVQIAYIHWGTEYKHSHSRVQRKIAKELVQLGFDLIVGHHPHVAQDIDIINGVPVFYSLGNYVFDQYFSTEVQRGVALSVGVESDELSIKLIPVGSNRSMPYILENEERLEVLKAIAQESDKKWRSTIVRGEIRSSIR
jgi:poly-gamma-glutamate capsule biosynthesis protein CapA/YwtB (metallophosphatase superfamily)